MTPAAADDLIELLYADAVDIYERARSEVMIPRRDGTVQRYAPTRYKQQIDRAYANGTLVPAIARIVGTGSNLGCSTWVPPASVM
mgnify:CR=1 FL=1